MRLIGIDPGLTGALAFYDKELDGLVLRDMPTIRTRNKSHISEIEIANLIRAMSPDLAVIELVHALPRQGVTSMFNFGVGFGVLRGVLAAFEIPIHFMTPQEWRRLARVTGQTGDKGASRIRAQQLFPTRASLFSRTKDHGRADAALLVYAFLISKAHTDAALP